MYILKHAHPLFYVCRFASSHSHKHICKYEILGLTPSATEKQIKDAYYKKSMKYHPDRNKALDAADLFQQLNIAYETLSNKQLRQEYDVSRGYNRIPKNSLRGNTEESTESMDIKFNRKIHSRLRKTGSNFKIKKEGADFNRPNSYIKIKNEDEFYDHLPEDMKKTYKEYLRAVKEKHEEAKKESGESLSSNSAALILAFTVIFSVIALVELIGRSANIFPVKLPPPERPEK